MRWTLVTLLLLALILVPFFLFEDSFNALADRLVHGESSPWYVAAAIVGLLASDVFLPIPSSIVSAAAGVLLGFWRGAAAVWIGMMAACLLGYVFGARASAAARRFVGDDGMARAASVANRYGDLAIVLSRPVPVLAEASVIFAGIVHRPFGRFLSLTLWSNLGIALGYAAIGAFSMRVESFLLAFAGAIALPGVAILASRLFLGGRRANRM
jgi:uncharacterized membrane protein YdjX (TVP38/TMEM64 family)